MKGLTFWVPEVAFYLDDNTIIVRVSLILSCAPIWALYLPFSRKKWKMRWTQPCKKCVVCLRTRLCVGRLVLWVTMGEYMFQRGGLHNCIFFFSSYLWLHSVRIEFREDISGGRVEKDNVQKKFLGWRPWVIAFFPVSNLLKDHLVFDEYNGILYSWELGMLLYYAHST